MKKLFCLLLFIILGCASIKPTARSTTMMKNANQIIIVTSSKDSYKTFAGYMTREGFSIQNSNKELNSITFSKPYSHGYFGLSVNMFISANISDSLIYVNGKVQNGLGSVQLENFHGIMAKNDYRRTGWDEMNTLVKGYPRKEKIYYKIQK